VPAKALSDFFALRFIHRPHIPTDPVWPRELDTIEFDRQNVFRQIILVEKKKKKKKKKTHPPSPLMLSKGASHASKISPAHSGLTV
jgi:hypothetical protein